MCHPLYLYKSIYNSILNYIIIVIILLTVSWYGKKFIYFICWRIYISRKLKHRFLKNKPHIVFVHINPVWEIMAYVFSYRKLLGFFRNPIIILILLFIRSTWFIRRNFQVIINMYFFQCIYILLKTLSDNSFPLI